MAGVKESRRIRPLRVFWGLVWGGVAVGALVVAYAEPGNVAAIPTVDDTERPFVLAYGVVAMLASFLLIATCARPRRRAHHRPAAAPGETVDEYAPIRDLRADGWYVVDGLQLPKVEVDHVAVGRAGVLAIQRMRTDASDERGEPAIRARIAAEQLVRVLKVHEIAVDVVPALLAWGPGLVEVPGGVLVHDSVAVLMGPSADEWRSDLNRHELLSSDEVARLCELIGDLAEQRLPTAEEAPAAPVAPVAPAASAFETSNA